MDNNRDFFDGLSETLTKTAKSLGNRLNKELESSKLHGRMAAEEKAIRDLKAESGSFVYSRYDSGEVYDGELGRLCLEIGEHYAKIRRLENEYVRYRGKKVCPSCGKEIGTEYLFCPYCGVAYPQEEAPKEEEEAKSVFEEEEEDEEKIVPFEAHREDNVPFDQTPAPEENTQETKEPGEEDPEE